MAITLTKEQIFELLKKLKVSGKISDLQSVNTKETITLKKFEGEYPKECKEEDLVEIISMEFEDGVLKQHNVIKPEH